uniref:Uncharacterized protein n=1 Tax=Arion vulgaris TaxID=1028688 RepID=A0A0B6YRY7_9EUPU
MIIMASSKRDYCRCYVEPILTYRCESWTLSNKNSTLLETTKIWFYRRMIRISWTEKTTNHVFLLTKADVNGSLSSEHIRKKQATFYGHGMRREKL